MSLVFSLVSIIIAGLSFWYSYKANETSNNLSIELHKEDQKFYRINKVVEKYTELKEKCIDSGISGLIKAGISSVENESEAKEVIKKIKDMSGGKSPLSNYHEQIENVGILKFFKRCTLKDFQANRIEAIIIELQIK